MGVVHEHGDVWDMYTGNVLDVRTIRSCGDGSASAT